MATKVFRGLGNMTYKDKLRELSLSSEKMHSDGKRGNSHNLEHVKFQLCIMKKGNHEDG